MKELVSLGFRAVQRQRKISVYHLEILLNTDFDSVGLGWDLRCYIPNICSDADAVGSWNTL